MTSHQEPSELDKALDDAIDTLVPINSHDKQYVKENKIQARKDAKQAIKQAFDKYVIGEGELHVSHVCPQDSISCREFAARDKLRNAQHKSLWDTDDAKELV